MGEYDIDGFFEELKDEYISEDGEIFSEMLCAAECESPVLIMGPTGTGKELVASIIHRRSQRTKHNFVPVNCALIPKENLYAELFGVAKGSYTNVREREGLFQEADKGTIFLDEIGDLPIDAQAGLLRVLETGQIRRLGQDKSTSYKNDTVDVRIIAATNKPIWDSDCFRGDLYHRLKAYPVFTKALSENRYNILYLLKIYLDHFGIKDVDFLFFAFCLTCPWEGNVRELKNFCSFTTARFSDTKTIELLEEDSYIFFNDNKDYESIDLEYFNRNAPALNEKHAFFFFNEGFNPVFKKYTDFLKYLQTEIPAGTLRKEWGIKTKKVILDFHDENYTGFTPARIGLKEEDYPKPGKYPVRIYIYPKIKVKNMPGFDAGWSTLIPGNKNDEVSFTIRVTKRIVTLFHEFEKIYNQEPSDELNDIDNIEKYPSAKQKFEENFYRRIFLKYGHLSDLKISKIVNQSDKTIKKKREKYRS